MVEQIVRIALEVHTGTRLRVPSAVNVQLGMCPRVKDIHRAQPAALENSKTQQDKLGAGLVALAPRRMQVLVCVVLQVHI